MRTVVLRFSAILLFISASCEMKPKVVEGEANVLVTNRYEYNPETALNFDGRYFSGQAEVLVYSLEKARYDSIHRGQAILVQVVEPFLYRKQVKNDSGSKRSDLKVLKSNYFERFTTGVYDYSLTTSTFTPLAYDTLQHSLKITASVQDWCGQTFVQLNNRGRFSLQTNSYFEREGDSTYLLERTWQEDELMNLIRLSKDVLPKDTFLILPKASFLSTNHIEPKAYKAVGSLSKIEEEDTVAYEIYSYSIPELKRTVNYYFDATKHNRITKIEEEYPTVFDGVVRRSTAKLKSVQKMPYWELNSPEDSVLRKKMKIKH